MKTREEALAVLKQYNESDALLRHGYAVEGVMRHFAALKGEDVEYWGQVGLLHDVDYEKAGGAPEGRAAAFGGGGL